MPELPEVQTIISDLNKKIKGDVVIGFWSDWPKAIKGKKPEKFKKEISGRKILAINRIGKNIFIELSGGKILYLHLKMTGHLLVKPDAKSQKAKVNYFIEKVNQYIHHIWKLKSGKTLEFSDLRKFGKIVLDNKDRIKGLPEIKKLGIDAVAPQFTFLKFREILTKRKNSPIGTILADQNLLSGIGNIYRSEILFNAGILPQKKAGKISLNEAKKIFLSIGKVLKKAIKFRGTSDSDYRDTAGAPGNFQKVLKVYRREGEKCEKCGTIIKRAKLGQRSIFFCPKCQLQNE